MLHHTTTGTSQNPPLILLHGFLGSCADFAALLPSLSAHFYCIACDLPGHGSTNAGLGNYSFTRTAQALIDLLDHLKISKAHVLGYSMGGRIALYLACEFPDRIEKVIVESASPGLKTERERQERQRQDDLSALRLLNTPLPDFLKQWYDNPLFADLKQHPDIFAAMLQRRLHNRPEEAARGLCGLSLGRQPSLWNSVSQLKPPLLIMVGELDSKFVSIGKEMFEVCQQNHRQATFSIFEQCGHNLHLVAPNAYINSVVRFFSQPSFTL